MVEKITIKGSPKLELVELLCDAEIIVRAVAECDPWEIVRGFDEHCHFCKEDKPEHTDDCPYILARKIIEDG